MKERIRECAFGLGVDDIGFAAVEDYRSPLSPPVEGLFEGIQSLVVLAFQELSSCESANPLIAMNGRLDLLQFARSASYRIARFIERESGCPSITVSASYPLEEGNPEKVGIGELSLRHAAVAAGLGRFGMHNLVVHPRMGSRVIFAAVLTKLRLDPDPPVSAELCTRCGLCIDACPAGALKEKGKTDRIACYKNSQPYGQGASVRFWTKFGSATAEERKAMMRGPDYARLYQAGFIGYQYVCFRCMSACPAGKNKS